MIYTYYFIFIYLFFDIIIIYHIQLYFFTLFYICVKVFQKKSFINNWFIVFFVIFFWGYSLNFLFKYDLNMIYYFFIINGCLVLCSI